MTTVTVTETAHRVTVSNGGTVVAQVPTIQVVEVSAGIPSRVVVSVTDPGNIGSEALWIQLPPDIDPPAWEAATAYILNQRVQPTVPNGRYFTVASAVGAGESGAIEPTWPATPFTVVDNDITWDSHDIVPVPSEAYPFYVRNAANDGWVRVALGDMYGGAPGVHPGEIQAFDSAGVLRAHISILFNGNGVVIETYDENGTPTCSLDFDDQAGLIVRYEPTGTGATIGPAGLVLTSDDDGNSRVLHGTVDPSAGAGVEAEPGSTYHWNDAGVGKLCLKTGANDDDWEQLVP